MKSQLKFFTFILASLIPGPSDTPTKFRVVINCEDQLSWFTDCSQSLFFNAESHRCKLALVKDYKVGLYWPLNMHLRGIRPDPTCEEIQDTLLAGMMLLETAESRRYYRGVRHFSSLDKIKPRDCLIDKGYMSMSRDKEIALNFSLNQDEDNMIRHLFEIEALSAKEINGISEYAYEEEAILLPHTPLLLIRTEVFLHENLKKYFFKEVQISQCQKIYN